ncbi:MAG: hypothetical protein ACI9D5_001202 [Candidatus Endobugula sp.]|jgi:hypothetical protein
MKLFLKTATKKSTFATLVMLTSSALWLSSVYAHDPAMHKKANAEKPKCEAMGNMDNSTMDKNDPIMMAMMEQCQANADDHHTTSEEKKAGQHKDKHDGQHKKAS